MLKYVLKRFGMLIPVVFCVVLVVFVTLRLSPVDPIRSVLGDMATEETVQEMRDEMGLNDPIPVQFFNYIKGIVTKFDFGVSYTNRHDVLGEISKRFPVSIQLAILSTFLAAIVGIPLGVISAVKQYSLLDSVSSLLALIFLAMPGFWLGIMLIIIFAQNLKWFPASGWYGAKYMVLPIVATGMACVAGIMRTTRSNMLEVIRQDYIRTAKAKGLKFSVIIWKHALKNALIPVITIIGMQFGRRLGGVFVIETIFAIPGIGKMMIDACAVKNIPVIQVTVIFVAVVYGIVNLLVDLVYSLVDPRMAAAFAKSKKTGKGAGKQ